MTIKKKICDKCRREIPENEPGIEFTGNLVFVKSGEDKTHNGSHLELDFCEECGISWILSCFPRCDARIIVKNWTGKEVLTAGVEDLFGKG